LALNEVICNDLYREVEAFSGNTATTVKQDIYANAMIMSLCAVLALFR
jgi:hypothetical protein